MVTALDNRKQQLIQDILKLEREDDVSKIEAQVKAIQTEKITQMAQCTIWNFMSVILRRK